MARDRGIVRVRQAHLAQTRRAAPLGLRVGRDDRKEAVDEQLLGLRARDLGLERAADQLRAAAEDRDRRLGRRVVREQLLLRAARRVHERALLH